MSQDSNNDLKNLEQYHSSVSAMKGGLLWGLSMFVLFGPIGGIIGALVGADRRAERNYGKDVADWLLYFYKKGGTKEIEAKLDEWQMNKDLRVRKLYRNDNVWKYIVRKLGKLMKVDSKAKELLQHLYDYNHLPSIKQRNIVKKQAFRENIEVKTNIDSDIKWLVEETIGSINASRNLGVGQMKVQILCNATETATFRKILNDYNFKVTPRGFEIVVQAANSTLAKRKIQEILQDAKNDKRYKETLQTVMEAVTAYSLMNDKTMAMYDWMNNTRRVYDWMIQIYKNLIQEIIKGNYDSKRAHTDFVTLTKKSIPLAKREFPDDDNPFWKDLSQSDINLIAAEIRDSFEVEADLGNFDEFFTGHYKGMSVENYFTNKKKKK